MTLDEVMANVRAVLSLGSFGPAFAGFRMHPKTYEAMQAHIRDATDAMPAFSVHLTMDPWMPVGLILPVDHEGKPIPKPVEPVQSVERGSDE